MSWMMRRDRHVYSALRRVLTQALLYVLIAQIVVLPIAQHPRRAYAQTATASADSFTFSDVSPTAMEHAASTGAGNSLKPHTSPIGASGAFTQSVTIRLPPGRSGMTPALALNYASDGARKPSAVGAGWSFGVGSITRSTEQGFPALERAGEKVLYATKGPFVSPSGPLVDATSTEGLTLASSSSKLFLPKRETSPVRYEFVASENRWIEHLPNGNKRFYGQIGTRSARVTNELGTHEWLLLEERDPEGNSIEYDYYYLDDILHGQFRGNFVSDFWLSVQFKPLLKSVRWGGNINGPKAHMFSVGVTVRDFVGDVDMMNGHVQNKGLVERISVFGPPSLPVGGITEAEYWHYDLSITPSVDTGRPLLRSVTEALAGAQPRTTTFSYSSNGNPFAVQPGQSTCNATRDASFDPELKNLPSNDPEVYRSGGVPQTRFFDSPIEWLSSPGYANAYQFRDMDADGDADIVYLNSGIRGPAAQWLLPRSHQRNADGNYMRFGDLSTTSALSIPQDLMITEFADVDGDVDSDAISFPMLPWGNIGARPFFFASDYASARAGAEPPPPEVTNLSRAWSPAIDLTNGFRMLISPTPAPKYMFGARLCWLDPRSVLFNGTFCNLASDICTPRPDDVPLPGDPKWKPWDFIQCANGPWPWCKARTGGVRIVCGPAIGGETDDYRNATGHGPLNIKVGFNSARGSVSGVRDARIDLWPTGLIKTVVPKSRSIDDPTEEPCKQGSTCTRFFGTLNDFQAPATDLNGDGKADLMLLKAASSHLRDGGGAGAYFIPRAYLSDGQNFTLDWPLAVQTTMSVDVSSLTGTTPAQLGAMQTYRTAVLPVLRTVRPGERTVPTALTDAMTAANRTALTQLLNSYTLQDANDESRVRSFRAALIDLFDRDLWARIKRPVVPLKKIFDAWNAQLAVRALTRPELIALAVPTLWVPAVDVDLSPILFAGGNGTAITISDLLDVLQRPRFVIKPAGQASINLASLGTLMTSITNVVVNFFGLGSAPTAPRVGSFTWSARQIFSDGREVACIGGGCSQNGDTTIYPVGGDFNALPLDLNSDGLPELVVASRPRRIPSAVLPGQTTLNCFGGHQTHINRGYRWDTYDEWADQITVTEQWSTPAFENQLAQGSAPPSALSMLKNRAGKCADGSFSGTDLSELDESLQGAHTLPLSAANFSDINADGLVDLVFASNATRSQNTNIEQRVFLNTGLGFRNGLGSPTAMGSCVLPTDFIFAQNDEDHDTTMPLAGRSRLSDVDNDGLLDAVYSGFCADGGLFKPCVPASPLLPYVAKWRKNLMRHPDMLTRVEEPAGAWTEVDYVAATSDAARGTVVTNAGSLATGYLVVRELRSGAQPIALRWLDMGGETAQRVQLQYDNYVREEGSTRAVGFERVTATFASGESCSRPANGSTSCAFADQSRSTTTYDVRPSIAGVSVLHPLRGAVAKSWSLDLVRNAEIETTQTYAVSTFGNAARIRLTDSISATREGGGATTLYTATQEREPDEFGFFKKTITGRSDALGQINQDTSETSITTRTFKHVASAWRLGRPATESKYGDRFDEFGTRTPRALLSHSVTEYGADNRVSAHKVLLDAGSDCATTAQWGVTTFENYVLGLPKKITDNGTVISMEYDAFNLYTKSRSVTVPASVSSPGATLTEQSAFDPRFGTVSWTQDMNDRQTTRSFDWQGRLLVHIGPDNNTLVNNRYDDKAGGPWTVITDNYTTPSSSYSTWSAFDGYERVLATNKQVGSTIQTTINGTPVSSTPSIRVARNRYDGLGRLVASYQPTSLAALDRVAIENAPLAACTQNSPPATCKSYDGFDRVLSETLPDKRTINYVTQNVTENGSVYTKNITTNPRGLKSERLFDANGALISVKRFNADGTVAVSYSYQSDGVGRMVSVADSLGVRRIAFDEGGRLAHATLPRATNAAATVPTRVHSYCYDTRSKLISASTPEGRQVDIDRDGLGRTSRISVDYEHKRNGQNVTEATTADFYYDCAKAEGSLGRLCRQSDNASTTRIAYDLYGRATRYEVTLAPTLEATLPANVSNWYAIQLNYGQAGQLKESTIEGLGAGLHRVAYAHDLVGRTNSITLPNEPSIRTLVSAATYDPFERVVSATLGNSVVSSWEYSLPSSRLISERMAQGSNVFAQVRYPLASYDENDNIKREERWRLGELVSEKNHSFNALDELDSSQLLMNKVERKNERFSITQGNLTSVSGTTTATYGYGDASNVQAVKTITAPGRTRTISYDADGWVSQDIETTTTPATITDRSLVFDAGGCMREAVVRSGPQSAPQTTTTRNLCGFGGVRAYRETTKPDNKVERVYYLPDGSELRPEQNLFVMQLPVAKSTMATLAWSLTDGTLVQSESGYIHTDIRGSVLARTPLNASDVRIPDREAEYDAWGGTLAYNNIATPRYQYTNEEPDPGTGYYYFGARPYDPTLRRWLAPDPLMMGSMDVDAYAAEQLNLYAYAANNPITRTDKNGRIFETITDVVSIAAGIEAIGNWDASTSLLDKVLDVGGLVVDTAAALIPGVPGGAGIVKNLATHADDVGDAAKALHKAEQAKDAGKVGGKAAEAAKTGKAADAGKAADSAKQGGTSTGRDSPAAEARAKADAEAHIARDIDLGETSKPGEGVIYEVPGTHTPSGRPYVGSTDDLAVRTKNARDGRDRRAAKPIGSYPVGDKKTRKAAEQTAMDNRGGKAKLDNKRDEIKKPKSD